MEVHVIGAGLAGSEAAWQLAQRGVRVRLMEMRPGKQTPAHHTGLAAEMVCSNSFKSEDPASATGILKAEMRRIGSLVLDCAERTRVPAGQSLAVDREAFSREITTHLQAHPGIHWEAREAAAPEPGIPTIIATGPLSSDAIAAWITAACGRQRLFFYDAIAPIVLADSIDTSIAFRASRYGKGEADFLNCPLDLETYEIFLDALLRAERAELHDFDTPFFEACLPIEVMADRGRETLRFGPMKPVGLNHPETDMKHHAVVQLRQDTLAGDHYNIVGFQTRLKWSAQSEIFRLIPGLAKAEFARFGSIHRNTYVQAPEVLDATLALRGSEGTWIAGQLSGVEGYLESAAAGMAAADAAHRWLLKLPPRPFPRDTMLGSLLHYLAHSDAAGFSPVNAMLGLLPDLPHSSYDTRMAKREFGRRGAKRAKAEALRQRALAALEKHLLQPTESQ
jgi:methylenetetrahydrofolate--tRNA-(uracil-5-)-methyltransferase